MESFISLLKEQLAQEVEITENVYTLDDKLNFEHLESTN